MEGLCGYLEHADLVDLLPLGAQLQLGVKQVVFSSELEACMCGGGGVGDCGGGRL